MGSNRAAICLDCENARADRCAWISDLVPVWKEATRKTVTYVDKPGEGQIRVRKVELHVVTKCDRFKKYIKQNVRG